MADEKLNTGPGEEKLPEALLLLRLTGSRLRLPNRPPLPHPSMRDLPSPSRGRKRGGGKRAGGENAGGTSRRWG